MVVASGSRTIPQMRQQRILVIDDEPRVREVVTAYLERAGYRVQQAADATSARTTLATDPPDLVILDVMFPGASGLDLLVELRRQSQLPVILLTARAEESDRILGLELGSDDYVTKPFSPRELTARVKSVLRRTIPPVAVQPMEFGALMIDPVARTCQVAGVPIDLTAREFDLLAFLAAHPRQVFTRGQLLQQVWDSSEEWQDPATVTVHIRRIRNKIEANSNDPRWLATVWGVGYRFEP
jgi:DNA-binding response OmpR family regulator